jgi:two-component system cell cycle response regulator
LISQTTLLWVISAVALAAVFEVLRLQRIHRRLRAELRQRRSLERDLHRRSAIDPVTGVLSRRGFMDTLHRESSRAARNGYPLSVVMLDFDHFKEINDTYGHACGDLVLSAVARACQDAVREPDFVGRLGGDEFAVGLPHTDGKGARETANRICTGIAATRVETPAGTYVSVTTSAGCAVLNNNDTPDTLRARADSAVYEAKRAGRNRVAAS